MTIIHLKKFIDFKDIVEKGNFLVFYKIEGNELYLYVEDKSIFCIKMIINNPEGVDFFLQQNFKVYTEILEVEE